MIKKIFITLFVLIVLAMVGIAVFLLTFDLNHYREFTQKQLSKALNYPVQIGSMHTKLSLIPTIRINNFRILQNGENPKVILDVPQVDATVELIPLLKKKIEINRIEVLLVAMDLSALSKNAEQPTDKKEKKTEKIQTNNTVLEKLWADEIVIKRVLCRFMNKDKKEAIELNNLSVKELNKFKFNVEYMKKQLEVDGSVGLLTRLITNPKNLPIDLRIKQGEATATLKGQIGDLFNLEKIRINANINITKMGSFLKKWNITAPKFLDVNVTSKFSIDGNMQKMVVKGLTVDVDKKALFVEADGQLLQLNKAPTSKFQSKVVLNKSDFAKKIQVNPFEMTLNIEATQTKLSLSDIVFRAGRSDLSGSIEIDWKDLLNITPDLTSSYLNLKDIIDQTSASDTTAATSTKKTTSVIPNTSLNWDILKKFNLKGKINIDHLFLTDQITDYMGINATPKLNNGALEVPFKGRLLAGTVDGKINLNAHKRGLSLKFNGQNLDLDKIRSIDKTIKGSKINTDISLNSWGATAKAIASNLNGKIIVELIGGTITDKWFNSLPTAISIAKQKTGILDFSTSDQKTDIMCGAANIPIKNGILTSDEKIVLQTSGLNFTVKGQVNLKNETVNLTVIPSVNQTRGMANQLLTTVQSIHLEGPWTNIKPTVDVKKAVENITQAVTQKLSKEKPQVLTSTELCQKILGKKVQQTKATTTSKKQTQTKQTQTKQTQPAKQENLKQQLMESLAQALQQKVQK